MIQDRQIGRGRAIRNMKSSGGAANSSRRPSGSCGGAIATATVPNAMAVRNTCCVLRKTTHRVWRPQNLGDERLNEPAGLKQRFTCAKQVQQHIIRDSNARPA